MKNTPNSDGIYAKLDERIQALKTELEQLRNTGKPPKNAKEFEALENLLDKKMRELRDLLAAEALQRAIDNLEAEGLELAQGFKKN